MTSLTCAVPAVTDWLVAAAKSSTALGSRGSNPVIVLDGPEITADTLAEQSHLWIGGLPGVDLEDQGAEADQDFAYMDSGRTRDERGWIQCAADYWTGSVTMKSARDGCAAIVGAVELLLRGTPAVGGPGDASMGGLVLWSQVTGPYQWSPRQTDGGAGMLCKFRISYYARLTTGS